MEPWQNNPYNVRHFVRDQHRRTRLEVKKLRLAILGVSEQLSELQIRHAQAIERQTSIVQIAARIVAVCAIVAVTIYLSNQ